MTEKCTNIDDICIVCTMCTDNELDITVEVENDDPVTNRFDNFNLDFWRSFTVPAEKRNGYDRMTGNLDEMTSPHAPGVEESHDI